MDAGPSSPAAALAATAAGSDVGDDAAPPGDDDASADAWLDPTLPGVADGDDTGDDAAPPPPLPPFDAGPGGVCPSPPGPGDLAIVELMIASVAGAGDHGEWIEIESTRDCALDLYGLEGDCPSGAKVASFAIDDDVWLPARGRFVVADSLDPALDHALPGLVVAWSGSPGDVLRNQGTTITLHSAGAVVDTFTYPKATKLPPGVSMAFPSACPLATRASWGQWQPSQASWFPGFYGTPNAPNDDVTCAAPP
jgi:hypothetical protein